jgi:hypothetical protein
MRISGLWGKITVLVIICCCSLPAQAKYGGGTGKPNEPYLIFDANQMNAIGADSNDWDKCFKLMADIDLSSFTGMSFNIIGTTANPFTAVFDGNGHTISNFSYTTTDGYYAGLFEDVNDPNAEIRNLGLIDPNINARRLVGSLVVYLERGTLTGCSVDGGSISLGSGGGLVGKNSGTISDCSLSANVSGDMIVGGLVGDNWGGTISNCYSNGSVSGISQVGGGFVGANSGTIINCHSNATVSGLLVIGGLVGANGGTITNCYATGSVSGMNHIGGLVGWNDGIATDSFWDIQTSGKETSDGGEGRTTEQMMQQSTFQDWDFINVWDIGEKQTYPYLRTVPAGDINKDRIVNFLDFAIIADQWLQEK